MSELVIIINIFEPNHWRLTRVWREALATHRSQQKKSCAGGEGKQVAGDRAAKNIEQIFVTRHKQNFQT